MIETKHGGLLYYQFEEFLDQGLFHGVFSRQGGTSPDPWNSLNLGGTVGDDPQNVQENLSRLLGVSGFSSGQLAQVKQIHSAKVINVDHPVDAINEGDAMISEQGGVLLLMRFADCVPILFFDPVQRAIAIAHAGWKGTLKGLVAEVVHAMRTNFGTLPAELLVGIGPSIGPDHYQVRSDVIKETEKVFPDEIDQVLSEESDGVKLDLWKANEIHLRKSGVRRINVARICTACDLTRWYSHRAEEGRTGRFAAAIGLEQD